jgi:hypothetical protein
MRLYSAEENDTMDQALLVHALLRTSATFYAPTTFI